MQMQYRENDHKMDYVMDNKYNSGITTPGMSQFVSPVIDVIWQDRFSFLEVKKEASEVKQEKSGFENET